MFFRYGIDAFDAIAIVTALMNEASVFWTVDVRLIDCIEALRDSWPDISRIRFRCPISMDRLRVQSRERHTQKARRNIENAILNLPYTKELKMRRKDFLLATEEAMKFLDEIIEKYASKPE